MDGFLSANRVAQLRVIKTGSLLSTPFVSLTVDSSGERGLLGIAFDPNFATNRYLYVYYTVATSPIHNRVSRFTAAGDTAVRVARPSSWNSTISAPPPTTMAARSHHRQQNRCDAGCLRALGPSLQQFGIANPLPDPWLALYDANGTLLASDDN